MTVIDSGDAFLLDDRGAQQTGPKRAGLRRMHSVATSLLGAMLMLLLTSAAYQATHPWLHWVRAFAEAGAAGAMADWYAVVALFRHPIRLPIPHSAVIPKNKDRSARASAAILFGVTPSRPRKSSGN